MKKLLVGTLLLATSGIAHAVPVQWTIASGGNGHWYEYSGNTDFSATYTGPGSPGPANTNHAIAVTQAALHSYLGVPGHLVTINSAAENSFVGSLIDNPQPGAQGTTLNFFHIGLDRLDSSSPFAWVTGEPVTYTNWASGQPGTNLIGALNNVGGAWTTLASNTATYFIVEYAVPVPLPAAGWLLLSGLGALGALGRRRLPQAPSA